MVHTRAASSLIWWSRLRNSICGIRSLTTLGISFSRAILTMCKNSCWSFMSCVSTPRDRAFQLSRTEVYTDSLLAVICRTLSTCLVILFLMPEVLYTSAAVIPSCRNPVRYIWVQGDGYGYTDHVWNVRVSSTLNQQANRGAVPTTTSILDSPVQRCATILFLIVILIHIQRRSL